MAIADLIPDSHADLLKQPIVAFVATIGPDGEPQNNPVWFDWDGEYLRFSQGLPTQKYLNLQRDPRIAMAIVDANNPYRYLEIRGVVERFEPDPDNAFINAMARKYMNRDTFPYLEPGQERVTIVVRPAHTTQMG